MATSTLLLIAVFAVALLLFLVIRIKLSAFVALILVSMITAFVAGIPLDKIMPTLIAGMGGTLGSITIIVGLGAILGKLIEESGGAESLADYFTKILGQKRTVAALACAGFVLGIPIFVDVGFIILVPIVLGFARINKANPIVYGIPVVVCMLVVHVIVPPHPGPVAAAGILTVDVGMLTLLGLIISIPTAVVGFITARIVVRRFLAGREGETMLNKAFQNQQQEKESSLPESLAPVENPPSVGLIIALILIPIGLIMCGTVGATCFDKGTGIYRFTQFIGSPGTALMISIALAFFTIGVRRGWALAKISDVMDSALPAAAVVILVTGGGGVFGKVLTETGVGTALADTLAGLGIPVLPAGFLIAAALRASQGSATVAILTSAGLLSTACAGLPEMERVLVNIAIGFGSLGFSHINDSLFWILTKYLGISVSDGLRTWTIATTVTGIAGFIFTWLAAMILL
ncbi:MAG: GntP family transporter [Desulfovibrionaceae bacterium]|nr:GntP family transporter [Desulfovibrionaceae bacterium]